MSPAALARLTNRGGAILERLKAKTGITVEIGAEGEGVAAEVHITGDPNAVAAAKREVGGPPLPACPLYSLPSPLLGLAERLALALRAWCKQCLPCRDACLVGRNPTCSVPAL